MITIVRMRLSVLINLVVTHMRVVCVRASGRARGWRRMVATMRCVRWSVIVFLFAMLGCVVLFQAPRGCRNGASGYAYLK